MTSASASTTQTTAPEPRPGSGHAVVAAQGLVKVFKDFWLRDRARAVDGIDFVVERGEIFGLLGPNGSGKSTTIKMILGLLRKTSGRLQVFGRSPHDVAIKKRIGYLPEESYLYPFLNARETLEYYAKLFRLDPKVRERRIDELLEMVGLTAVQHRQVREYSKGMQRRIGLAQALINDPEFLILDEPTTGLDPIGTRQVKDLIIELGRRGKTILLSSHLLSDVEDVVSRMVILYGGKIRRAGTVDELLTSRHRTVLETDALDDATLEEIRGVLSRRLHELGSVSAPRQRLEELFVEIVESARRDRVATSGAENEGGTAAFLRGEGDGASAEGSELIDRLISGVGAAAGGAAAGAGPEPGSGDASRPLEAEASPADAAAAAAARADAERAAEAQRKDKLLDDLLVESEDEASSRRTGAGPDPDADPADAGPGPPAGGADDDVIRSLLRDGGGEGEGGRGDGSGDGGEETSR